jgi:acyl-coenzyme A synthetase/AMP-(fatty) acid ligase
MFADGWFYPGDVGILRGPRQLQVIGRGDELLNLGGQKLAPSDLEALVARHAELADVGVCSLRNAEGVEEICVGVVAPAGDDRELIRRVARALEGLPYGTVRTVRLPAIPRNANGKILRAALKEAIAAAARLPPS